MKASLASLMVILLPWISYGQYQVNGNSSQTSCNCFELTPAVDWQAGSVWNVNTIDLTQAFDFNFEVFLGCNDNGADGIVFGMQPIGTAVGGAGVGMGFQGVSPSFGVYIDTYQNFGPPWNDPAQDHLSINSNGVIDHDGGANDLAGPATLPANIEDCAWHTLRLTWDPTSQTFTVYFDGTLYLTYIGDIVNNIFGGTPDVFWGMTSATGNENNNHQFCTTLAPQFTTSLSSYACPNQTIQFTDTTVSFGQLISWSWDFGDGNTSTSQHPTHAYGANGNYDVTLSVTDASGCTDSVTHTIAVASPTVTASATPNPVCAGETVQLDATITPPVVTTAQYCQWQLDLFDIWGDGWNGASIDVFQNGVQIGNYTLNNGGSGSYVFDVLDGSTITMVFNGGQWDFQCSYDLYDNNGTVISSVGAGAMMNMGGSTILTSSVNCGFPPPTPPFMSVAWTPAATLNDPTLEDPTATPTASTTYTVTVTDTANGCSATDDVFVSVVSSVSIDPIANVTACDHFVLPAITGTGLTQNAAYFTATGGTGTPLQAGDSISSVGATTLYAYDGSGNCSDEETFTITIIQTPTANAGADDFNCTGLSYQLSAAPSAGSGNWTANNGVTFDNASDPNATVTVPANGAYTLNWTVSTGNGCTSTDSVNVTFDDISFTSVTVTDESCFNWCDGAISVASTVTLEYSIDGGTFSTATNFTGLCAGTHTITAQNNSGCSTDTTIVIHAAAELMLNVSADTTICNGDNAVLTANASGGVGGYIYDWDSGQSTSTTTVSPLTDQQYCVSVTDSNGCTASAPSCVTVFVNPPLSLTTSADTTICEGEMVVIWASGSSGDGTYTYTWDDSSLPDDSAVTVSPGTYVVTVADGCGTPPTTVSDTITVGVSSAASADFTPSVTEGCGPLTVYFTETGQPEGSSCVWDFGNGNTLTNCGTVSNVFTAEGCHDVSLTVTTPEGCTSQILYPNLICVHPTPVAEFDYNPQPVTVTNTNVSFTNYSTNASSYVWTFGSNPIIGTSTETDPEFTFSSDQPGSYQVCLMASSSPTCYDTTCQEIVINDDFLIYVPNAFSPNGDGINDVFLPALTNYDPARYQMQVFNRWGEEIFTSRNATVGWDGTIGNEQAQIDVYVWKISAVDQTSKMPRNYMGHVTIVR